jgi:hypothetical protein
MATVDWKALVDEKRKKPETEIKCENCGARNNVDRIGCGLCGAELR